MKKTIILVLLVFAFLGVQAQTHNGVVNTSGSMVGGELVPGTMLSKIFGKESEPLAEVYNDKSVVYLRLGNIDKALEHHSKALDIRKKVLKPDRPKIKDSGKAAGEAKQKLAEQQTK